MNTGDEAAERERALKEWFGTPPEKETPQYLAMAYWVQEAWNAAWQARATLPQPSGEAVRLIKAMLGPALPICYQGMNFSVYRDSDVHEVVRKLSTQRAEPAPSATTQEIGVVGPLVGCGDGHTRVILEPPAIRKSRITHSAPEMQASHGAASNFCPTCGKRLHAASIHTCTPPGDTASADSAADARDAARYRWLLDNYARGDGYSDIDAALNDGEPEKYLSPAIDAQIAAIPAKDS